VGVPEALDEAVAVGPGVVVVADRLGHEVVHELALAGGQGEAAAVGALRGGGHGLSIAGSTGAVNTACSTIRRMEASGKFVLRIPTDLHAQLVAEADRQSVSLNQLCVALLAGGIGF